LTSIGRRQTKRGKTNDTEKKEQEDRWGIG
jgi:hypothetical protein